MAANERIDLPLGGPGDEVGRKSPQGIPDLPGLCLLFLIRFRFRFRFRFREERLLLRLLLGHAVRDVVENIESGNVLLFEKVPGVTVRLLEE